MTAAVYRNTQSLSIPQTQNTAPVYEFNCLYTHDVKKKQKKWQDGFLRYHTFNKRVMVYDVPRNLIGDCHWTGEQAVQEGDELRLERVAVMVEVGDSIGQTETDLTELRKSRKKDSEIATPRPAVPRPAGRPVNGSAPMRPNGQQKHRSLGALLGTPKGPLGKATLPQKSPFEDRHASVGLENEEWEDGRPPKRQRMATAPEWNVTRNTTASKPVKQPETPLWARKVDAAKKQKKTASEQGQQRLATREVITLSDDDNNVADSRDTFLPGFSDDALAPSSPVKDKRKDVCKVAARSSSPAFQTQNARPAERPSKDSFQHMAKPKHQAQAPPKVRPMQPPREKSPVREPQEPNDRAPRPPSENARLAPEPSRPVRSNSGQTLRLAASAPKKSMLLCQAQVSKKPKRSSTSTDSRASKSPEMVADERRPRPSLGRETLEDRLARIDKKGGSTSLARLNAGKAKSPPVQVDSDDGSADGMADDDGLQEGDDGDDIRQSTHERSAIELRRLDEMMLPPAAPPKPPPPPKCPSPPPQETRALRRVASESMAVRQQQPKRVPGAPVRYTPTPSPTKSRQSTPVPVAATKQKDTNPPRDKPPAPARANKQNKPLQKSVSLNVTSNGTSTVILSKPFQAPGKAAKVKELEAPKDLGPWSREAFDLFTWRPPNWDEEKWCVKEPKAGAPTPPVGLSGGASLPHVS